MDLKREQILDVLFTAATIGVGLLIGNPVMAGVVGSIGAELAADLTQRGWRHFRQRVLGESGLLNHDLQQTMIRAFRQTIVHLEREWWQTSPRGVEMKREEPEAFRETSEVFKNLQKAAENFCTPDRLGRAASNEQVQKLLYGDETAVRQAFSACLADYLYGHDSQLVAFIEKHLVKELAFWFGEDLKADRPESDRAWRAFQRLLLEGLRAELAEVLAVQQEILDVLNDLSAWQEALEQTVRLMREEWDREWLEIQRPPEATRPPEVANFVGREAELAYFADKLETSHLAIISGIAGVGKTALAAVLARQVGDPGKIFWHSFHEDEGIEAIIWELAGFLARDGKEELWRTLQSAWQTGGQMPPPEVLVNYLIQMVRGQGYLLCLDDFQFADDDPRLDQLAKRLLTEVLAGELSLIITSRRIPDFVGTLEFEPLAGLSAADTRRLVAIRGLLLPRDLMDDLYANTEGNAQCLMLAIDALQHAQDPATMIARLSEATNIERWLMTEIDKGLTEDEQAVMSAVAVLLGYSGTRDALETILGKGSVRRTLIDLSNRYLLTVTESKAGREYGQHAMVRAFYYDLLGRRERQVMHCRAGEYYETEELDALKAARHFERAGEYDRAARLATAEVWGIINQGQARALRSLLGLFTAQQLDATQWAEVNIARGQVYALLGQGQLAQGCYLEALSQLAALSESPAVHESKARACRGMGDLLQYESSKEALDWLRRGLDELRGASVQEEAALYIKIGAVEIAMGNYDAALSAVERGLKLLPKDAGQLRVSALINLGTIYSYKGDTKQGSEYTHRALEISQRLHDDFRMLVILSNLGVDKYVAGDWEGAISYCQQAVDLAEHLGSDTEVARLKLNLGIMHVNTGDNKAAKEQLLKSLDLACKNKLHEFVILNQSNLAVLHLRRGELETAEALLTEAERLVLETDTKYPLPEIYRRRAQVRLAEGQPNAALEYAEQSVNLARDFGQQLEEGKGLRMVGRALLANGQREPAMVAFEQSLLLLVDRDPYEAARTKMAWGLALVSGKDPDSGAVLLQEVRSMFHELGAKRDLTALDDILDGIDDDERKETDAAV